MSSDGSNGPMPAVNNDSMSTSVAITEITERTASEFGLRMLFILRGRDIHGDGSRTGGSCMKKLLAFAILAACVAATPVFAHSLYPLGWNGPYSNGGTTSSHPENLCQHFASSACIVAAAHASGVPLTKWRIDVRNSRGLNTQYYTNDTNTPGWIVVVGVTGISWTFEAMVGSYNGNVCAMFTPGPVNGIATQSWSGGNHYYQATFSCQ
jgi:hypothetical protein